MRLYAKQSIRNIGILQGLREMTRYHRHVDVINEAVRLFLLPKKRGNSARVAGKSLFALLSRDVHIKRLAAFEKFLDERSEILIGVNNIFF